MWYVALIIKKIYDIQIQYQFSIFYEKLFDLSANIDAEWKLKNIVYYRLFV